LDVVFPNTITINTILNKFVARKNSFDLNGGVNLENTKFYFVISEFNKRPSTKHDPKTGVRYFVRRERIV